jgi:hypothetical protein
MTRHRSNRHCAHVRTAAALALPLAWAAFTLPVNAADYPKLSEPISLSEGQIRWQPGPDSLPEGAEIAILEGDLTKQEPHTFRLKLPDGYRVAPHSHPLREHITVLEGVLMMGMGETFEREGAKPLGPNGFFVLPVGDNHYVWTHGETVAQLHGVGPWGIDYVNPEDDPRGGGGS